MQLYVLVLSCDKDFNKLMRIGNMVGRADAIGFINLHIIRTELKSKTKEKVHEVLKNFKQQLEADLIVSVVHLIKIKNGNDIELNRGQYNTLINSNIDNVFTGKDLINLHSLSTNTKFLEQIARKLLPL